MRCHEPIPGVGDERRRCLFGSQSALRGLYKEWHKRDELTSTQGGCRRGETKGDEVRDQKRRMIRTRDLYKVSKILYTYFRRQRNDSETTEG